MDGQAFRIIVVDEECAPVELTCPFGFGFGFGCYSGWLLARK